MYLDCMLKIFLVLFCSSLPTKKNMVVDGEPNCSLDLADYPEHTSSLDTEDTLDTL